MTASPKVQTRKQKMIPVINEHCSETVDKWQQEQMAARQWLG
jgi:hypothetical protein